MKRKRLAPADRTKLAHCADALRTARHYTAARYRVWLRSQGRDDVPRWLLQWEAEQYNERRK